MLDYGTLREKLIICILCLSGIREGTLVRLQYHHIKDVYEGGIVPIRFQVHEEMTKGRYHDYDSFFGAEAADYPHKYIEARKKGGVLHPNIRLEEIHDDSPIIRDEISDKTRGSSEQSLSPSVRNKHTKSSTQ